MTMHAVLGRLGLAVLAFMGATGGIMAQQSVEGKGERIVVGDGVWLHAEARGSGPDTVIVPLAAWLAPVFAPLADDATVILYDMRGRGRSAPVRDPELLGIERDIADLEAVRRHFGVVRPAVIGFSYLGAMVARYAAAHPGRVGRLVQVGPMAPRNPAPYLRDGPGAAELLDPAGLERLSALREAGVPEADPVRYCRAFWEVYGPLYVASSEAAAAVVEAAEPTCRLANEQPDALLWTLRHVAGSRESWDWRPEARGIGARALVIHGTGDRTAPVEGGREWAAVIPDARILELEGAGHMVWLERGPALLAAIETFLAGDWPADAAAP